MIRLLNGRGGYGNFIPNTYSASNAGMFSLYDFAGMLNFVNAVLQIILRNVCSHGKRAYSVKARARGSLDKRMLLLATVG